MITDALGRSLETAMTPSEAAMVLSDPSEPDCPIVAVNAAFVAMTGYEEAEAVGRNRRFL